MKKIVLSLIASGFLVSGILPSSLESARAESKIDQQNVDSDIKDVVFIEQSDGKLEYTYTKGNEKFKNVEYFNENQTGLRSYIYKLDKDTGEYQKVDELVSQLSFDKKEVSIESLVTKEKDVMVVQSNQNTASLDELEFSIQAKDKWTYHGTVYGDNKPKKWTIGVIGISIAGITRLPAAAKIVVSIANMTYQLATDVFYYKKVSYKKGPKLRPSFKFVTTFYADKARKKVIKKNVVSYVDSGYR